MNPCRTLRYASVQARLRARIGEMPDAGHWRAFIQARDVEDAVEQMRGGLAFWVEGLARRPGAGEIERHCNARLVEMAGIVAAMLPGPWRAVAESVEQLPRVLLAGDGDSRAAAGAPDHRWLDGFRSRMPRLAGQERLLAGRLAGILQRHWKEIEALRREAREGSKEIGGRTWPLREAVFLELRLLFAGDPFNGVLVLAYGLMEAIQFERVRAVLLMHALGWSSRDLTGGAT